MSAPITLAFSEKTAFTLRALYAQHGYSQYKMSKFEEYDLYSRNKDFLISDGVITFTDAGGRLMALKPDVTLSIVKNVREIPGTVQKLYYNENVYRTAKGSRAFKEIMQLGLECIGELDDYCLYEVLHLAARSLLAVSPASILDISHLGILTDVIRSIGIPEEEDARVFHLIGERNLHELTALCAALGCRAADTARLCDLVSLHGAPDEVLPRLTALLGDLAAGEAMAQFSRVAEALNAGDAKAIVQIDFSVVDDIHYYNGFVCKGFVEGIPTSVLSGGQYDRLMKKMKKNAGAIGFAVYLDNLEPLESTRPAYDADTVLLYDEGTPLAEVQRQITLAAADGSRVSAMRCLPPDFRCRKLLRCANGEVETLEDHA